MMSDAELNDAFADLPPHLRPTAQELQMGIEAAQGGQPLKPATAAQGVADMDARINLLTARHATIQKQWGDSQADVLADLAADIAVARRRRADYAAQLGSKN